MKIIETPSILLGHRFRHEEFLLWIRETRSLTAARNWANVLSLHAKSKWMESREQIQATFATLYEEFCAVKGIDHSDVGYDNFDFKQYKEVIAKNAERKLLIEEGLITPTKLEMLWEVLEDGEEVPATQEPPVKCNDTSIDNLIDSPELTRHESEYLVHRKYYRRDNAL